MGYKDEDLARPSAAPKSLQAQAVEQRKRRKVVADEAEEEGTNVSSDAQTHGVMDDDQDCGAVSQVALKRDPIPTKCRTLQDISMAALRDKVVGKLEASLSSHNLRAMRDPDAVPKVGLIRLLDFATGISPDLNLSLVSHCYTRPLNLCLRQSRLRGRRAALIQLPPDWANDGLARVCGKNEDGDVEVLNLVHGNIMLIKAGDVPSHSQLSDLHIEFNWSEKRLSLASRAAEARGAMYNLANFLKQPALKDDEEQSPLRIKISAMKRAASTTNLSPTKPLALLDGSASDDQKSPSPAHLRKSVSAESIGGESVREASPSAALVMPYVDSPDAPRRYDETNMTPPPPPPPLPPPDMPPPQ